MKIGLSSRQWIYYLFCGAFFVMPMGTSPFTILGGLALAFWIFSGEFIRSRHRYLGENWLIPVLAIICLYWVGLIWSQDASGLGIKFAKKTHYWLFAFAITSVPFTDNPADRMIKAFLIGLCLNALVGFLQYAGIIPTFVRFTIAYTGFYGGYNTLEILLVLGMMSASFFLRTVEEKRWKMVYGLLILVYFFHLVILIGRGGYLTFAILLPFIIHNILHRKRLIVTLIVYLAIIGAMFFSPIVQKRAVETVSAIKQHFSNSEVFVSGEKYSGPLDRIYMWRWAIHLFMQHPFLGVGTGGYYEAILSSGGDMGIAHPHNNVLYVAVSFGILGLIIFGWFFWILIRQSWRNRASPVGYFILSSVLVILVGGLVDTHILDAGGAFLLAVTTGLLSFLPKDNKVKIEHASL